MRNIWGRKKQVQENEGRNDGGERDNKKYEKFSHVEGGGRN